MKETLSVLAPPMSARMEERRIRKGRSSRREMKGFLADPTPSEVQTSHLPTIVDGSDEETGKDCIDVTAGEKFIQWYKWQGRPLRS